MKLLASIFKSFTGFSGGIFTIGVILIFLGISTGLPSLGIQIEEHQRTVSWTLGLMFCLLAIGLRFGPKEEKKLSATCLEVLTRTQKSVLDAIVAEYKSHGIVSQDHIEKSFKDINKDELYYRLEALILLKLIEKKEAGHNGVRYRFSYQPTAAYREMAHIAKVESIPVYVEK